MLPIGDKDAIFVTSVLHATTITSLLNANCQHPLLFLNVYVLGVGNLGCVCIYVCICIYMCMRDVCNREMEIQIRHQYVICP